MEKLKVDCKFDDNDLRGGEDVENYNEGGDCVEKVVYVKLKIEDFLS